MTTEEALKTTVNVFRYRKEKKTFFFKFSEISIVSFTV